MHNTISLIAALAALTIVAQSAIAQPMNIEGQYRCVGSCQTPKCIAKVEQNGTQLVFTNEVCALSTGTLQGNQVVAHDWGGLIGDITASGDISWRNPTKWMRVAASTGSQSVAATETPDVLVQRYDSLIQRNKLSIIEKLTKEANTPEGRAIIGAIAASVGLDPKMVNIGVAGAAKFVVPQGVQDMKGIIRSPVGYTICYAAPANKNMGAGQHGIETHGDTTFNTSLIRVIPGRNNDDGLAWYMVVPFKAGTDTRVAGVFDVVFVKAVPNWREKYSFCRPSGEHPWLARNNGTRLNVPCGVPQYCE